MGILHFFLISFLPVARAVGLVSAVTQDNPVTSPVDPLTGLYQSTSTPDGKIDRIILTFDGKLDINTAVASDFEVIGYQVLSVTGLMAETNLTLTLNLGDVQDTGATPLVKFYPGRLRYSSDGSLVASSLTVTSVTAIDGAAPVLDLSAGQVLFRPNLDPNYAFPYRPVSNDTGPGTIFMSFSERVNVSGAAPLLFVQSSSTVCKPNSTTTPRAALDGPSLTSTSHVTLPSLCNPANFQADGYGFSSTSSGLNAFAQSITDSQQLKLSWRQPSTNAIYYFSSSYDPAAYNSMGNSFDEATMLFLIGNDVICNRGTNVDALAPVTFRCNSSVPIRPKVIASSLDLDGNGVIDTIQVRTRQDRLDYIKFCFDCNAGEGWSLGDATTTYWNGQRNRSDVRIDTYVPNVNASGWTLPGYNITGATSERGRILLSVTPYNSSIFTTSISGSLNYPGTLTTWTGNLLDATNIVISDKTCPVIVSVMGYGGATNMTITFSEPLTDATVTNSSFISLVATTFNPAPFTQVTPTPSPGVYVASFSSPLIFKNFRGTLPVQISGLSTILQADGTCPLRRSYVTLAPFDTTPPGVLSVYTRDRNGNGRIDGFTVYFNKSVTDETVNASSFNASGFFGLTFIASTLNDSIVDFTVTEAASINTSLLTSFSYANSTNFTLVDLSNNPLIPFSVTTSDGVGPYPVSLQTGNSFPGVIKLDKIVIQFSEPVNGTLIGSDFVITNPSITPDSAVTVSGSTVTLRFASVPFFYAASTPQVAYTNRSGQDFAGNLIPSFALSAVDRIQPVCGTAAVTGDLDNDGRIDTIYIQCTENVTNIGLTSFTVQGYTIILATVTPAASCVFPNSVCVNLTVQEQTFSDTGATPQVNYTASPAVTDMAGNLLQGPFPILPVDAVSPVAVSVLTQDLNHDGKIDAFQVTFSENVTVNSIARFSIASYAISSFSVSGPIMVLNASAIPISVYDGGATPSLVYTGTSDVTDFCTTCSQLNKLIPFSKQSIDGVFPIVLSALTAGSCKLQTVQISMNEDINPASVNITSFSIPGYTITNYSSGGVSPYGFSLIVSPYPLLTPDIVTPNVTYSAPLSIVDNNANPMVAFSKITLDKLAPCLVSCAGHVGGSYIAVTFSEPVYTGISSPLTLTNFQLLSSSNAINSSSSPNSTTAFLSMNATFIETDINFNSSDNKASVQPLLIHDANGNNASASCLVMNDDHVQPNLVNVSTVNTNDADFQIDRILLKFDKQIADSTMDITAWTVAGYNVTNFSTGVTANDQLIFLILSPKTVPDTGATPLVTYTRPAVGGFTDRNRNPLNSTSMIAVDNARPLLTTFAATIFYSGNTAVATFSEPVYGSPGLGLLNASSFVYNSTNGNAASIQTFQDADGSDGQVSLVLNTLALTDFNADFVLALAFDAAGNQCVARPVNVTKGDTIPPVFMSADTQDLDHDGQIDHLIATFNESVLPSTFLLSYFSLAGYTLSNVAVNDTVANFTVNPLGTLDGAATPIFNYTPGVVSDLNGNLLGAFSNSTRDRIAPFLLDCSSTLPNIVTIDCLFSEAVSVPSGGLTAFQLAGALVGASVVNASVNGSMITISLSRVLVLNDFTHNGTVDLTLNGPLVDLAGNTGLQRRVFLRNTDVTPPVVVDVKTADQDCNGFIDHIVVQFNEGIIDSNVSFTDFTLGGGYVIVGKDKEAPLDDNLIFLLVDKQATPDTDAANFTLTYTPGTLTDLSNNLALTFAHNVRDGTGVALLNVTGYVDTKNVYLQFSGPFSSSNDLTQLDLQNFSARGLSLTDSDGSDGNLTVMMTGSLLPVDFATPASIVPFVLDLLGNAACFQAVPLTNPDHAPPTIVSVETHDEDSDGRIDSLIFNCSENIDELSLRATDFTVGNYTVIGISGFPVSSRFKLSVAEKNETDAFVTPMVSYISGSLTDRYGNKLAGFANMPSVDRIGPAIISATGLDSTLRLLFSKPIFNVTNGTMFNFTDVTYTANANGTAPNVITSIIDSQGSDSVLSFGMVRAFTAADFAADTVSGGTNIFDVHGNALNSAARVKISQGIAGAGAAAATPGLTDTQVIGIAVGCGGGLLLLILVAVLCVVCKKKGWACFKKKGNADFDQDQGGFDFGGYGGTEMTQSSKGVARLEA